MLTGFDEDLAKQITQNRNRIRGLHARIRPGLERVLGPRLEHHAILALIQTWPTPHMLHKAGKARIAAKLKRHGTRRHQAWAQEIIDALATRSVAVTGTNAARIVIPHLAQTLDGLYLQRAAIETETEALVTSHPLFQVLTSMPGIGVRTAAIFIAETAGKEFANAAHLSSCAGLAPTTRQSGTSIKSETTTRSGNRRLKRALFLPAFPALRADPTSRHYYDRKRSQGKRHNQALLALAHQKTTVLHAMLRDGTFYENKPTKQPA